MCALWGGSDLWSAYKSMYTYVGWFGLVFAPSGRHGPSNLLDLLVLVLDCLFFIDVLCFSYPYLFIVFLVFVLIVSMYIFLEYIIWCRHRAYRAPLI